MSRCVSQGKKGDAAKTLGWAGATPSCRKIAARSLRASGVTPASGCSGNRSPCFGRAEGEQQRICKTVRNTKPQGGIKGKNGNHQSTTQATEDNHGPGSSRGGGENPARSIRKIRSCICFKSSPRKITTSLRL